MGPFAVAINPDGESVYVANNLMNGAVRSRSTRSVPETR